MDTQQSLPPIGDILAGQPIPVGVAEIDKELVTLWQATAQEPDSTQLEGRTAVTLVRALNLITYVEGDERSDEVNDVIRRVSVRHPCRSIMLVSRGGGDQPGTLTAWISAHCHLPSESDKQICSEQITVAADGRAARGMPGLALHLLIADTPVFLWWTASKPFEDLLMARLSDNIDRLIVDSAAFAAPIPGLLRMAGAVDPRKPGTMRHAIGDFNWTRLTDWRESTAQFFDPASTRPYLRGIAGVEIDYGAPAAGRPANPVQALLFAGWLAQQLGWQFEAAVEGDENAVYDLHLRADGRPVTIHLQPVPASDAIRGGLSEVRIIATRPGQAAFSIRTDPAAACATTSVSLAGGEPLERTMVHVEPDEAALLDQELELFAHDPVYEQALQLAGLFARGSAPAQRWSIIA